VVYLERLYPAKHCISGLRERYLDEAKTIETDKAVGGAKPKETIRGLGDSINGARG
jgi:hypothetical protein